MTILEWKSGSEHEDGHIRCDRRPHNLTGMHPLPTRWAIWHDGAADGATNMATDAVLLSRVRTDTMIWRWYSWDRPTISFGRHEATGGRFSADSVAAAGLHAVRRPTGGRALLHAREITYSVTGVVPAAIGWRVIYDAINARLVALLRTLGVEATLSSGVQPVAPNGPVCFDTPADGEITVAGRKLVGSAVWRQRDGYLQHGSVLVHDDQPRLLEAALRPMPAPPPAATLAEYAPTVDITALAQALPSVLRQDGPAVTCEPFVPSADVRDAIASQYRHFIDPGWLWRR
jgi:lipoyl(octanoyl) transferase